MDKRIVLGREVEALSGKPFLSYGTAIDGEHYYLEFGTQNDRCGWIGTPDGSTVDRIVEWLHECDMLPDVL